MSQEIESTVSDLKLEIEKLNSENSNLKVRPYVILLRAFFIQASPII